MQTTRVDKSENFLVNSIPLAGLKRAKQWRFTRSWRVGLNVIMLLSVCEKSIALIIIYYETRILVNVTRVEAKYNSGGRR